MTPRYDLRQSERRRRAIVLAELMAEPWTLQPRENNFGAFALDAFRAAGLASSNVGAYRGAAPRCVLSACARLRGSRRWLSRRAP
jgi:hypothetical protein